MPSEKISVGITGLMGSGKSEAANYLKRIGYPVLFMDKVGHDIISNLDVIKSLREHFGQEIFTDSNNVNRKRLSKMVFNDQTKLTVLNSILHPKMNEKAKEWIASQFERGQRIVFLEAAILFEMKMNTFLDFTVLIKADKKKIVKRIMQRDKKTLKEIAKILRSQKMNEENVDYVIDNDGTLKDLYKRCDELLEKIEF